MSAQPLAETELPLELSHLLTRESQDVGLAVTLQSSLIQTHVL